MDKLGGYKVVFFIMLCVIFTKKVTAQNDAILPKQIFFRELTVDNGLSQNSVVSIAQDSTGFMWFATQDGLNKYDGKTFTHYERQFEDVTRPTFSKLGKVYVDKDGYLWIISISGKLEKFNEAQNTFSHINTIKDVSTIFQTSEKDYFIGTYGNGIYKVNSATKDTTQILSSKYKLFDIYDITEIENDLLIATSEGVLKLSKNTLDLSFVDKTQSISFSSISIDKNATIYAASFGNGLYLKRKSDKEFSKFLGFDDSAFLKNLNIQDILVDSQDRLWVATYGNGAYLINFNNETIDHFIANKNDPYALHYNDVLSIYEDFTETIWLGTDGAGLSYYDRHLVKFNVLTNRQIPPTIHVDVVRSIVVKNDIMWLGTSGKGLTKIDQNNKKYKTYTAENSTLAGNRVMSLLLDGNNLWIGHQNEGLQLFDQSENFKTFSETKGLTIWKVSKKSNDELWLCTRSKGLLVFNTKTGIISSYNTENSGLTTNNIRTIAQGNNQTLWVGTENDGLFKLNLSTNEMIKIEKIPDNIKCLYYSNNLLWVGTNGNGLKLYNISEKNVVKYTKENGLPNNVIYGILPDDNTNLWLSSNKGLTKISIDANYNATLENYNNYDGLQAFEFNTGAYFIDEKGTLYFGGLNGINWFQPNQLSFNPKKPKTVITGLKVFNEKTEMKQDKSFLHNQNTFTFSFSSLHYSQPERNQYKYRLINNDEDWISSGNNNEAHYTNLPPNEYSFQVISSNYDGVWNNKPATYSFSILKPWYTSNLAVLFYCIALLAIIYGIYAYLKWRWNVKNQLRLEHEETERLKKIDELKTRLYTNISHEIRTPLTLISGPVENQLKKKHLSQTDISDLNLIKHNSNRLLQLVNQMLDLSLVDSGELKLSVKEGNLSVLLKQIISSFKYKAESSNLLIESKINGLQKCWFDKDVIEKIISNLITNAIKYSPDKSKITIEASENKGFVHFSITNNKGDLNIKNIDQLFERFYQTNSSKEGVGIGLSLVKELIKLSKGTITAEALSENTISFLIKIPITEESFAEYEKFKINNTENTEIKTPKYNLKSNEKPVLLVVEDNDDVREFIVSNFSKNYTVIEAENGQIGIKLTKKHLPSLIISDIMMPIMNGIELCNIIKNEELTSHIPIILLTAKVGEENEIKGFKTGADAYITKPFGIEKLHIRVQKLIESRQKLKKHFNKTFELNPKLAITSTETEFLNRMQEVLDKHITDPELTSEQLSKFMNMSRTQLHRKLTSILGLNTTAFIRSQRLKLACKLLRSSDASTSEIAYQVGFSSPSYFTKCFKEAYGCTPSEFIIRNKSV